MIAESVTVDRFNDPKGSRTIRARLRVGEPWAVTARTVISELREYSGEHPDAPDGSFNKWMNGTLGNVIIEVKAKRGRLYKCPECGCMCRAHEYVDRTCTHVSDMGHECELHVNLPKLDCKGCGRKLQIRFPPILRICFIINVSLSKISPRRLLSYHLSYHHRITIVSPSYHHRITTVSL